MSKFLKNNYMFLIVLAIMLAISHMASIFYVSYAESETFLPIVLYYVYNLVSAMLIPMLVMMIVVNKYKNERNIDIKLLGLVAFVLFVDRSIGVIYDLLAGDLEGIVSTAILFNIALIIHSFIFVLICWFIIKKYAKRYNTPKPSKLTLTKYSPQNASFVSLSIIFLLCLFRTLYNIVSFFIQYGLSVTPQETQSMFEEVIFLLLSRALIPALCAFIVLFLCKKNIQRGE